MTSLSLKNPVAILMIAIGLCVLAVVVAPRLPVDTFPELAPPVLVVGTQAPGLGPKDVEKTLTWRIEKYVSATPGVDHVESLSRSGLSVVYVWLKWGTDLNAAQSLVQQQAAFAMSAVPKSLGVLPPFVLQYDPTNAPVVQVAVWGEGLSGARLYDFAQNEVEPILEGISGVASAAVNGGRIRQINIVVDPVKAQAVGLTSNDISNAVRESNALLPSGQMLAKRFDANVYTDAVPLRVKTIGETAVKARDGRMVLIRDVAKVEDGGAPETQAVAIDGRPGVYLNVLRIPGGNTLEIVESVKKEMALIQPKLPTGMKVQAIFDQSVFVRTSYHGLRKEILQALVLIAIVILVFLQSPRSVLVASISIPLAFSIILLVLSMTGQTLNAFTLGGLTLAMGPLVDISVVVLESVHRQRKQGLSAGEAAQQGTGLVAVPTLAAMLSTLAVLLPIVLLYGLARKLFGPLALTVGVAMVAGWLVSMSVTPVACRFLLGERHREPGPLARFFARLIDRVAELYAHALRAVLPHRAAVLAGALVLVSGSVWASTRLPTTFFPEIDESMERVYVRLSPGTSLEDAAHTIQEMGETLRRELPKGTVELVLTNVGAPTLARSAMNSPNAVPNMGFIRLALVDPEHRALSQREVADRMREILNRRFPGVEYLQWPGGLVASVFANGYLAPLVVELRSDSLDELDRQLQAVSDVVRTVPGVRDVYPSLQNDYPEIRVETDRQLSSLVQVTARTAAQTALEATMGNINTPSVWIDSSNGQSYYVITSYDRQWVGDPNGLSELPVRVGESGNRVLLGAYSRLRRSTGPIAVERNQLSRAAHMMMQTEGRDIGSAAAEIEQKLLAEPRLKYARFHWVGQVELMRTTFAGLGVAVALAIMLVFMIMASQFKSLRLPLVMLFVIPVSLVGIVAALLATRQGFSITAFMGVLMVVGIAMSNGILLVDEAARRLSQGASPVDAVVTAARLRFVPIAMTSLATIVGLIPMALGLETGTEANRPLALAVVGGLTSSTVLSLFLVPIVFTLIAKAPSEGAKAAAAAR